MAEPVRVTALLPVKAYDPDFLRRAVDSIIDQTSSRWRLIVICDPENVQHFGGLLEHDLLDRRVSLVSNQGKDLPGSLNTGMRAAETDFCGILLGDDMWAPQAIEVLEREIADHPDVDFFHSARTKVDEEDRPFGPTWYGKDEVRSEDFFYEPPLKHLLCFRREMALSIGGIDESFQVVGPDDYDFPWSLAEHGASFRAIGEVLYLAREHHRFDRLSTDTPVRERWHEIVRMWRKHGAGGLRGRVTALRATHHTLRKGLRPEGRTSVALRRLLPRARR